MTKKLIIFLAICLIANSCSKNSDEEILEPTTNQKSWQLVWADEFDYEGKPDFKKWSYDIGGHGWGNNELQYYTDRIDNCYVKNGKLNIKAIIEEYENNYYTSARLVTTNKGDWKYGKIEVNAKLPFGKGTWPAIWMLPTNWNYGNGGWPDNGEIDIMEHVGYDPGVIHASTHCNKYVWTKGTQKTSTTKVKDFSEAFHTYSIEWDSTQIKAFVDDTEYFVSKNEGSGWEAWPFDKEFHLILNIAIGGDWGGAQGVDPYIFPQTMEIDYVRVYQFK